MRPPRSSAAGLGVLCAVGLLAVVLSPTAWGQQAPAVDEAQAARIAELIAQLGNSDFSKRESAQAELAQLGHLAYEALLAARENDDIEVVQRAELLLSRLQPKWIEDSDSDAVRNFMQTYLQMRAQDSVRESAIEQLARLAGDEGVPALCRIVQYERNDYFNKVAALALAQMPVLDEASAAARQTRIQSLLAGCQRPGAAWFQQLQAAGADRLAQIPVWQSFAAQEEQVLEKDRSTTRPEFVARLWELYVAKARGRAPAAEITTALFRVVDLRRGSADSLSVLLPWLVEQSDWAAIDKIAEQYQDAISRDPLTLYFLAQARFAAGREAEARELADQAQAFNPQNVIKHLILALELQKRGLPVWAMEEFTYVLDNAPPNHEHWVRTRVLLAELQHDQQLDEAAAQTLFAAAEQMEANLLAGNLQPNLDRDPSSVRARAEYFLASHYERAGDAPLQLEHLRRALAEDPADVEALISLYHMQDIPEDLRAQNLEAIQRTAASFEEEMAHYPDVAIAYNQYAWLIANTEGDFQKALQCSLHSLVIKPEEAGYLDTLARCYYALDDLPNAVKHQARAVELEPNSGQMQRQLQFFRDAAEAAGVEIPQ